MRNLVPLLQRLPRRTSRRALPAGARGARGRVHHPSRVERRLQRSFDAACTPDRYMSTGRGFALLASSVEQVTVLAGSKQPTRKGRGSIVANDSPPGWRSPKWSWGTPRLWPVLPTFPRTSPRLTCWPGWTSVSSRWQYAVLQMVPPTRCCTTMPFPQSLSTKTRTTVPSVAAITGSPLGGIEVNAPMRCRPLPRLHTSPIAVVRENPRGALRRAPGKHDRVEQCSSKKNESPSPGLSALVVASELRS